MLSAERKLLESSVCGFITLSRKISENQWRFVQRKSTEGMLTYLTEAWKRETGPWNVIGVVFIDFKKAFDCVSHSVVNQS